MLLIPAIDIKEGHCVRLRQGRMDDVTVFSDNPLDMARQWVEAGARRLHVVDLDGATQGKPVNTGIISEIVETFPDLPVQVGGGIRDEDTVQAYLDTGVTWVIIGTRAVNTPHFINDICMEFPGRIIVGLDVRDGKVAVDGWSKMSNLGVEDVARRLEQDGVDAIVFTDIGRDGMMQGFNLESTIALAQHVSIPVIASGGISSLDDIRRLCDAADEGITGAVIGRALYEKTLDLAEAQRLADQLTA